MKEKIQQHEWDGDREQEQTLNKSLMGLEVNDRTERMGWGKRAGADSRESDGN